MNESIEQDERNEKATADPEPKKPEQDGTASTTWDTDQHSDAPGPTGTG